MFLPKVFSLKPSKPRVLAPSVQEIQGNNENATTHSKNN